MSSGEKQQTFQPRLDQALSEWRRWGLDIKSPPILVSELPGGLTNKNFRIRSNNQDMVLRLNLLDDTRVNIDREAEYVIQAYAARQGISPNIYYRSKNNYWVREYIAGTSLTNAELNPPRLECMMKHLHQVHSFDLTAPEVPYLNFGSKASHYIHDILMRFPKESDWLLNLNEQLQYSATQLVDTHQLCHMDPLAANWILDETQRLYLIDWEYAALANPLLDFAALYQSLPTHLQKVFSSAFQVSSDEQWQHALMQIKALTQLWYVTMELQPVSSLKHLKKLLHQQ